MLNMAKKEEPQGKIQIKNEDRDALHILPLAAMPLQTPGLLSGVMIKNARLDSVLEVFRDASTGSGQVSIDKLPEFFPSYQKELSADQEILEKLASLQSFDVYALRINLRNLGIDVNSSEALRLSESKMNELATAMSQFTGPLLKRLYGIENKDGDIKKIMSEMTTDEQKGALKNMKDVSGKMKMKLDDLPQFIEDCGDLYLSIAYYENALMQLIPDIKEFIDWMMEIRTNNQLRNDKDIKALIKQTETNLKVLINAIRMRLNFFKKSFQDFWGNVSLDTFENLKSNLIVSHENLGAVLCGLIVKMNMFNEKFPTRGGSLKGRAEFIRSEIAVGLSGLANKELGEIK